jgi:branched-chain amino acid transport system substrate-binding protein
MCNCSGPVGSVAVPVVQGGQLWVKWINAKGGLNGHPVRQIVYDDGSDPARYRAQIQEAVEREKVVAFFLEAAPLSAGPNVDYFTSKNIPVVGAGLSDPWVYESPMYFPQASADRPSAYGAISGAAQQVVPAGKTKLGIVYCAEAEQCARLDKTWGEFAGRAGLQIVHDSPISLAQPDFTAVCLAARNAGVQVAAVLSDTNSISRFAASCARQGFRPIYTGMPPTVADRFKDDANIDSYVGGVNLFPFFQSGTPATDEYHAAIRTHGGGKLFAGVGSATGWLAGKLLEKAGGGLPEPPTTDAILRGLWSMNNDDLGGLTQPLTFVRGQSAPKVACWFSIATTAGKWVTPDGFQRHCAAAPIN